MRPEDIEALKGQRIFFSGLRPGTLLFGRYILENCLEADQTRGVYLCRDQHLGGERAVLKVFSTDMVKALGMHESFVKELRIGLALKHPNIARCRGAHLDRDFMAISMEYLGGGDLGGYLDKKGMLEPDEACRMLIQIAEGLCAIHDAGIIHRDLKPENILLDESGSPHIADFGLASFYQSVRDHIPEAISGSLNYLSPEYVSKGVSDERSDMYAFGIIAYQMLTGHLPFMGQGVVDTLVARVLFTPMAPSALRPEIPAVLSNIIMRAIQRDPQKRFASMRELLEELKLVEVCYHDTQAGEEMRASSH